MAMQISFLTTFPMLSRVSRVGRAALGGVRSLSSTTHEIELSDDVYEVFMEEKLGGRPSLTVSATSDELLGWLEMEHRVRMMEVAFDRAYKGRQIRGFLHLCDGQEAVVVGTNAGLSADDSITTAYRCHGYQLVRGGSDVKGIAAEMFGFREGCSKGKGGSMHLYSFSKKFWGGAGIVGAQVPLGAGVAMAEAYLARVRGQEPQNVSVVCFGDGAANQGQIHEAMNMAALEEVGGHFPAIFMCENNLYGMGTSTTRHSANPQYYKMGAGLEIPGIKVDGMDTLAMREAISFAKQYALSTGPVVIEALTYRFHGHSMSDPGLSYRSREEVQSVRKERDAIKRLSNVIVDLGIASEKELKSLQKKVRAEVDEAIADAAKGSHPEVEAMVDDIYHNEVPKFIRGVERV